MIDFFKKILSAAWSRPIFLLAIMTAAFGVFLPELGYYQDDWNHIYLAHTQGASSLWQYFFTDARPLTAWVHDIGFRVFGLKPALWQFSFFVLRFLTMLMFGLTVEMLWPEQKSRVLWMTIFFSIYPLFRLHAMAVAYFPHWMSYFLFLASLYLMVLAMRRSGSSTLLWVGSGLLSALHLLTLEYFGGLELLRPVIISFFIPGDEQFSHWGAKLKFILRRWGLYAPGIVGFMIYRIVIIPEIAPQRVVPSVLYDFLEHPVDTLLRQISIALQDILGLLQASWSETIQYDLFDFSRSVNIKTFSIMVISGIAIYIYMKQAGKDQPDGERIWVRQALLLGGGAVVLGTIPTWIVGFQLTTKNPLWNSRLGLPATFGLAILLVVVLDRVLKNRYQLFVFSMLATLSIGWHVRNLNDFRWSWDKQVEFYRQLLWRVPSLESGTALMSAGEFLPYMGDYPTAFAINTIYTYTSEQGEIGYWYADIEDYQGVVGKDLIQRHKYTSYYQAPSSDIIVVQFEPELNQCLWILTPENANSRMVPELAVNAAVFTKLERIYPEITQDVSFLDDLLNAGYTETNSWCYFYQKGDLAAQFEQWEDAAGYWEEAAAKGFGPSNGVEMVPFIKAYLYLENYDRAITLSMRAKSVTEGMKPILCNLWADADSSLAGRPEFDAAYLEIVDQLGCGE